MAQQETVLLPNEFEINKVTFSTPRTMKNGAKVVYIGYKGEKLLLQTPVMVAPFGINKWQSEDGSGPAKYSLDLSFDGMDQRAILKKFYDNLNDMDMKLIKDGFANHDKWLSLKKPPRSVDDVENVYTRIIKTPKDPKYSPTFKVNLPHDGSTFTFNIYDSNQNVINLFDMFEKKELETKRCRVSAIIQCTGIWVAGGKSFGCSWKVVQMEITPRARINGYAIRRIKEDVLPDIEDDIQDDSSELEIQTKTTSKARDPEDVTPVESDDGSVLDDDEEVVESEDELDEKGAKPASKKVVVTKK